MQKGDVDRENLLDKVRIMLGTDSIPPELEKIDTGKPRPEIPNPDIGGPVTLLVVEDNPDNMITIKAILQDRYQILEATDGESGLRIAAEARPNLILLDMALPKMDGLTVLRHLKDNVELSKIPVFAITAQAMKGDREKILAAGCDDCITKPIDPEGLLQKITEWLTR